MNLETYIQDKEARASLVAALSTHDGYLQQIATSWRGKKPSVKFARAIEAATAGVVTKESLRPDIWPELAAPSQKAAA